jgi:hypothetical protein
MPYRSQDRSSVPNRPGVATESNPRSFSNAASAKHEPAELIHFAKLAHEAVCQIETEKSKCELALRINQTREEERRQINMKLHDFLDRALVLTITGPASPHVRIPRPAHETLQQFRALAKMAYPALMEGISLNHPLYLNGSGDPVSDDRRPPVADPAFPEDE